MGPDRDGALIKEAGRLLDQGNELITERDRRIAELEAALKEIARVGYGIEINDTDSELAEYWSKKALRYQDIARKALGKEPVNG